MITRYEMWRFSSGKEVDMPELLHNIGYNLKALVGVAHGVVTTDLIISNGKSSHDIMIVSTFDNEKEMLSFEEDGAYEVFAAVYLEPYFNNRSVLDVEK
ncbi:MAG: hypothetical protein PHI41_01270 [Erysipelotrichaceae bacterium]|nr:hypothetical protein [Erysipelotrichaceae bacterium]MDD3808957.1 hypothetical protein [Erysipelotrichaceae bacterium]